MVPRCDDRVAREVRGSAYLWCVEAAVGLGRTRDVHRHLEKAVREWPELIWNPWATSLMRNVGRVASERSSDGLEDLRNVSRVIRAAGRGWRARLRVRRLESQLWAAAGEALVRTGRAPAALGLFARAVWAWPVLLRRAVVRKSVSGWVRAKLARTGVGRWARLLSRYVQRRLSVLGVRRIGELGKRRAVEQD